MKMTDKIKSFFANPNVKPQPAPAVLGRYIYSNGQTIPIVDQQYVKAAEPFGTKVPALVKDRASGWSQIANLSQNVTMEKVQAAFRAAERGDMTLLFGFYRDFFVGGSITAAAIGKRKLSTTSIEPTILPYDKKNPKDVRNAKVIQEIVMRYPRLNEAVGHMMNASVYPLAVLEKLFEPVGDSFGENKLGIRYKIKQLYPVDYQLVNYKLPYLPSGPINLGSGPGLPNTPPSIYGRPEDTIFDPDSWEPNLRFWSVLQNGLIDYSYANMMQPDPNRHLIYRSNLLGGIAPDNFGGVGKSLLFLTIMSQLGLNIYFKCLQKFGLPFVKLEVDSAQVDTVNDIMETFRNLDEVLSVIAYNKGSVVELQEMNYAGAGEAHEKFINHIKDCINTLLLGQTLSGDAKSTGLGSGVAKLHSDVRADYINYDRMMLNETLRHQLFRQLLDINGFMDGQAPRIVWGSGISTEDTVSITTAIKNLSDSGYTLAGDSIEDLSAKFGFQFEKMDPSELPAVSGDQKEKLDTNQGKSPKQSPPATAEEVAEKKVIRAKLGEQKHSIKL